MKIAADVSVTAITHFQYERELGRGYAATVRKFNFLDLSSTVYTDDDQGRGGIVNTNQIIFMNVVPTLPLVRRIVLRVAGS